MKKQLDEDAEELLEDEIENDGSEGKAKKGGGGGHFITESYDIFTPAALDSEMENRIAQEVDVLALDHEVAGALLRKYCWKSEKLRQAVLGSSSSDSKSRSGGVSALKKGKLDDDCSICFGSLGDSKCLRCGHRFCSECWAQHLEARLGEGANQAAECSCLEKGCGEVVTMTMWKKMLSPQPATTQGTKMWNRMLQHVRDHFCQCSFKDFKHCPKEECPNIVVWRGKANIPVRCVCGFSWCYQCQDADLGDHSPASCKDVETWMKKFQSESENMLYIRANTRQCPKCRSPIEKNGGCMHMTCRKCRHEFCWLCFADWKGHGACKKDSAEIQAKEKDMKDAQTELERFEKTLHRWEAHKKASSIARDDVDNIFELQSYYVGAFQVRMQDCDFFSTTLNTLMDGRSMLAWSYVREYYFEGKRISMTEKNLWAHYVSELEVHVDRLQEHYEKGKTLPEGDSKSFLAYKMETINLTRVARQYFDSFVEAIVKGNALLGKGNELERFYNAQLLQLAEMGFTDRKMLVDMLEKNGGDVHRVLAQLVE